MRTRAPPHTDAGSRRPKRSQVLDGRTSVEMKCGTMRRASLKFDRKSYGRSADLVRGRAGSPPAPCRAFCLFWRCPPLSDKGAAVAWLPDGSTDANDALRTRNHASTIQTAGAHAQVAHHERDSEHRVRVSHPQAPAAHPPSPQKAASLRSRLSLLGARPLLAFLNLLSEPRWPNTAPSTLTERRPRRLVRHHPGSPRALHVRARRASCSPPPQL